MALINCKNCGGKISDKAQKCPHCGATVKEEIPKEASTMGIAEENGISDELKPEHIDCVSDNINTVDNDIREGNSTQESIQNPIVESEDVKLINEGPSIKLEKSAKSSSRAWIWVLVVSLFVILTGGGVGGYFYYEKVYLPEKIDREAPRTYPIVNVFVRSSKVSGGEYNKVGLVPYGGELITYEKSGEWSRVKYVPVDPTQPVLEGYVASSYLLDKSDFDLLNGIFGNEEARQVIESAKCRRALLNYYKNNGLIGKVLEGDTVNSQPTKDNQWQIFLSSVTVKPNEVFFKRVINPDSKYTDFAVVMKNIINNTGRLVYFAFDDDETPNLIAEYEMPSAGKINDISYNINRPNNLSISTTVGTPFRIGSNPLEGYTYEGDGNMGCYIRMKLKFINNNDCLLYRTYGGNGMSTYYDAPEQCTYRIEGEEVIIDNKSDWRDLTLKMVNNGSDLEYRDSVGMNAEWGATGWLDLSRL